MFEEMVGWTADEGVDYMTGETFYFAEEALRLNIKYQGVCCGAAVIPIPEVAEAMGRKPPASRYSEDMHRHFIYGDGESLPGHITGCGKKA